MIPIHDIRSIIIEPTSYCNLHCPQCDRFDRQGRLNKHMELRHLDFGQIGKNLNLENWVQRLGDLNLQKGME